MEREAERMLMPFIMEDIDVEKGLARRQATPTTQTTTDEDDSSSSSIVVHGTRIRFRILGIIAITIIPVFAILFVLLLAVIILYTLIPVPDLYLDGGITGVVNASLGTLGHAVIYPDVTLRIKLAL